MTKYHHHPYRSSNHWHFHSHCQNITQCSVKGSFYKHPLETQFVLHLHNLSSTIAAAATGGQSVETGTT